MNALLRMVCVAKAAVALAVVVVSLNAARAGAADNSRAGSVRLLYTPQWYEEHRVDTRNQASDAAPPDAARSVFIPLASGPSSTNDVTYHGGSVMVTSSAYAIYWAPSSHSIPSAYQTLINRWFSDLGGSSLYNIVTQYYEGTPPTYMQNVTGLGGSWVDTVNPYPHAGTGTASGSQFTGQTPKRLSATS